MRQPAPRYAVLARAIDARARCAKTDNEHWLTVWSEAINLLCSELPHGSGFDGTSEIDLDKSNNERLVFNTEFHHMDDVGSYDGWTQHSITAKADLSSGFRITTISGQNRNDIKEYIAEIYSDFLSTVCNEDEIISTANANVANVRH